MKDSFSNEDDFDNLRDIAHLAEKFEQSLKNNDPLFLDVEEFEDLIDYYLSVDNPYKAQKAIEEAYKIYPKSEQIAMMEVNVMLHIHKPHKALHILSLWEHMLSSSVDYAILKGEAYEQMCNYDKALYYYHKALEEIQKENDKLYEIEVLLRITRTYAKKEEYASTLKYYKKIIELDPTDSTSLHEIYYYYDLLDEMSEAVKYFNEFTQKYPLHETGWHLLGKSYESLQLYEKAIECYDYCLSIDEYNIEAVADKARTLIALQEYEKAINEIKTLQESNLEDEYTHYLLGIAYKESGQYTKAIGIFKKLTDIELFKADSFYHLADIAYRQKDYQTALCYINEAITANDLLLYFKLAANISESMQDQEKTMEYYLQALHAHMEGDQETEVIAMLLRFLEKHNLTLRDLYSHPLNFIEVEDTTSEGLIQAEYDAVKWGYLLINLLPKLKNYDAEAYEIAIEKILEYAILFLINTSPPAAYQMIANVAEADKEQTLSVIRKKYNDYYCRNIILQQILELKFDTQ